LSGHEARIQQKQLMYMLHRRPAARSGASKAVLLDARIRNRESKRFGREPVVSSGDC